MNPLFKDKVCLIITHVIPWPYSAGNEVRIGKLISWLRYCGVKVILLLNTTRLSDSQKQHLSLNVDVYSYRDENQREGFYRKFISKFNKIINMSALIFHNRGNFGILSSNRMKRSFYNLQLIEKAKSIRKIYAPHVVIAEYIFTSPILDYFPGKCLKIIDAHDMFSRKEEMVLKYGIDDPFACTPGEEKKYLEKADVVISIQDHETKLFRELVPRKKVITVGIDFEYNEVTSGEGDKEIILLIVGNDHLINMHGIEQFLNHSWNDIRSKTSKNVILRIVGKAGLKLRVSDDRIQMPGIVNDLTSEYKRAYTVINPVEAGTGLKIKSIEAIAHSRPLISMRNGVEGISCEGTAPYIVADNWGELTEKVLSIIHDKTKRSEIIDAAGRYAKEHLGTDVVYKELAEVFNWYFKQTGK